MRESKPDILIFFSDQHHAQYAGYAGHEIVKTPNLDRLAREGTVCDNAYTSCPLCVPARISFLTGQLPEKTMMYTNGGAIREDQATFIHSMAAEGYETVLCGRMHFLEEDQRHGFTRRIMGDFTPLFRGRGGNKRDDLGPFRGEWRKGLPYGQIIGGGNSPVLEYDRAVISAALEYLDQDHDKPQCLVVGTYAPHATYVAPPDLYKYYLKEVDLPDTVGKEANYQHPLIEKRKNPIPEDGMRKIRAAYYGMITNLDQQLGEVRKAWDDFLGRNGRKGIFIYLSDHGDMARELDLGGKCTFFEGSARIPLVFAGNGIQSGKRIKEPVSIMDIGPTLCERVGAIVPPDQDGISLLIEIGNTQKKNHLNNGLDTEPEVDKNDQGCDVRADKKEGERYVISEFMENTYSYENPVPGRMIRKGVWKYITYAFHEEYDLLFNLNDDPHELNNVLDDYPEVAAELKQLLVKDWDIEYIIERQRIKLQHYAILDKWGATVDPEEPERWKPPEKALELPEIT